MKLTTAQRMLTLSLLDQSAVESFEDARKASAAFDAIRGDWNWEEMIGHTPSAEERRVEADVSDDFDKVWLSNKIEATLSSGKIAGVQARALLEIHARLTA